MIRRRRQRFPAAAAATTVPFLQSRLAARAAARCNSPWPALCRWTERITANGGNGSGMAGGGGAGGSIYVNAGALAGSGGITANGGNGAGSFGGGGGGGRIAIVAGTRPVHRQPRRNRRRRRKLGRCGNDLSATGGAAPELLLDNASRAGAITPLQAAQGANLIVQNSAVGLANSSLSFGSLLVGSNAWLMASNANASQTLNLTVSGNATIQPGGGLIADGGGYTANNGPGRGSYYYSQPKLSGRRRRPWRLRRSLVGHQYTGGGITYDSIISPNTAGSGGGGYLPYSFGGSGGGAIVMNVSGALQVDGVLSANGGNGQWQWRRRRFGWQPEFDGWQPAGFGRDCRQRRQRRGWPRRRRRRRHDCRQFQPIEFVCRNIFSVRRRRRELWRRGNNLYPDQFPQPIVAHRGQCRASGNEHADFYGVFPRNKPGSAQWCRGVFAITANRCESPHHLQRLAGGSAVWKQ